MKMNLKSLAIMMSIAILAFFVGCSDDDDTTVADNDDIDTIIDDIVESGPTLSDGIYIVGSVSINIKSYKSILSWWFC